MSAEPRWAPSPSANTHSWGPVQETVTHTCTHNVWSKTQSTHIHTYIHIYIYIYMCSSIRCVRANAQAVAFIYIYIYMNATAWAFAYLLCRTDGQTWWLKGSEWNVWEPLTPGNVFQDDSEMLSVFVSVLSYTKCPRVTAADGRRRKHYCCLSYAIRHLSQGKNTHCWL